MDFLIVQQPFWGAVLIFFLRVINMSLDTMRVLFVMRGKKPLVWVLGFLESIIFVVVISSVLTNLDNPLNIVGYAAGFATGNVLGIFLENRLAVGYIDLRIISQHRGSAIVEKLRAGGYAVTEIPARGKDGMVTMLNCSLRRKEVKLVENLIREIDQEAFVTAEEVRPVWRGYWRV
jgi:uncharacterized protein YebE (UPF0316 family)